MWQWLLLFLGVANCRRELHPPPAISPPSGPVLRVRGEVQQIAFRNINKAKDHYTYNIELRVKVDTIEPPPPRPATMLTLRLLERPTWDSLSEAERQHLAPEGPRHTLETRTWGPYEVGQSIDVGAIMTSLDLALMAELTPK